MPVLSSRLSVLNTLNTASDSDLRPSTSSSLRPPTPPSPVRPRSEYGHGHATSRLSHEVRPEDVDERWSKHERTRDRGSKRASLMKFRNFSESHLSHRARGEGLQQQRLDMPPVPALPDGVHDVPSILRTAPTVEGNGPARPSTESARKPQPPRSRFSRSPSKDRSPQRPEPRASMDDKKSVKKPSKRWLGFRGKSSGLDDLSRLSAIHAQDRDHPPPSYGDDANTALALPVPAPRFSDSSRSDGSNASSEQIYGSTTTTTHTVSTHTTFFKLSRRNKNRNSLFPLPDKPSHPNEQPQPYAEASTPRASTSAVSVKSSSQQPNGRAPLPTFMPRRHTDTSPSKLRNEHPPVPQHVAGKQSLSFAEPGSLLLRNGSQRSHASSASSPLQPPTRASTRGRASTASSLGRSSYEIGTPPPVTAGSGRNSTSTAGRSSFGGIFALSRFRQGSDPHSPRYGSPGAGSKSNSFAMSREALVIPEREEGDTPGKYLERLEAAVSRSMIAGILSKSADPFAQAVLRSYTRRFPLFGEPIDMSLRKFLLEADLPKETQQVDRVIQAFADRYHECNPGVFVSPDQAYIIAFSLMMLHTDAFNKNNKHKMQKHDYVKNTSGQQVSDDVLGCFYDNICYTPFVHFEEEVDINGERMLPFKTKKSRPKGAMVESAKKPSGPLDPYNLLVEQKLDALRPAIRDFISMDDSYSYHVGQTEFDTEYLQRAFTHTGVLQIISARSRPTAYEGNLTNVPDPSETQAGIIDLKITKVGTLWRKAAKKKRARSPWQEWGAILTGSQMYLFKNAHWAKGLVHQFKEQQKPGQPRTPVVFKPPLHDFKPDALVKTDNAVALVDSTYNRHKNAFLFVRPGGQEEVFLADSEHELRDWLGLINYAAAFRAAGVRIRGMVGGTEEDLRSRDVTRLDSTNSNHSVKTIQTAHGEMSVQNRGLSPQLQRQVMAARRQIMVQKIGEAAKEITEINARLDNMLRNARHLLLLAPIAPKTRDDVIHAAAKADTMIKWTRRDIWRLRCHRDILAIDVQLDGVSALDLRTLSEQQTDAGAEQSKKLRPKDLSRLSSKATSSQSPPQSPKSPQYSIRQSFSERPSMAARRSMADSIDAGNDVFRTPPESATAPRESDWQLPPLQLKVQDGDRHRNSITSTHLSASSAGRGSLSHTSSASSVLPADHLSSVELQPDSAFQVRQSSEQGIADREVELMARTATESEPVGSGSARTANLDGAAPAPSTPESRHRSGVRRSLQKTLRDAHHHPSNAHKHKKGKDSDGTIRSVGDKDEEPQDVTPGLKREKARFILHGKQASVVQFGNDWPNERMKARREHWRQSNHLDGIGSSSPRPDETPTQANFDGKGLVGGNAGDRHTKLEANSPFARHSSHDDDSQGESSESTHWLSFREDASAADAYASAAEQHDGSESETPTSFISTTASKRDGNGSAPAASLPANTAKDHDEAGAGEEEEISSDPKRQTVIGPKPPRPTTAVIDPPPSTQNEPTDAGEPTNGESDADDAEPLPARKGGLNRDTVIGPSIRLVRSKGQASEGGAETEADDEERGTASAEAQHGKGDGSADTGEDGNEDPDELIDDEELRIISQKVVAVS